MSIAFRASHNPDSAINCLFNGKANGHLDHGVTRISPDIELKTRRAAPIAIWIGHSNLPPNLTWCDQLPAALVVIAASIAGNTCHAHLPSPFGPKLVLPFFKCKEVTSES